MKKLIVVLMILVFPSIVLAFEIEPRIGYIIYNDSETRAGKSLELRIKKNPVFISIQRDDVRKYGKDFNIDSIGIGFEHRWEYLNFWIKGTYYIPNYNKNGFGEEGLYYAQIQYWCPPLANPGMFDNYNLTYDNAFGGEIGIDAKVNLHDIYSWNIDLGITCSYRYLRINEFICGWNDGGAAGVTGWILEQNRDFGGSFIGGFITINF